MRPTWGKIWSPRSAFYVGAWPFWLGLLANEGTLAAKTFLQSSCQIISMLDSTKYHPLKVDTCVIRGINGTAVDSSPPSKHPEEAWEQIFFSFFNTFPGTLKEQSHQIQVGTLIDNEVECWCFLLNWFKLEQIPHQFPVHGGLESHRGSS